MEALEFKETKQAHSTPILPLTHPRHCARHSFAFCCTVGSLAGRHMTSRSSAIFDVASTVISNHYVHTKAGEKEATHLKR